VDLLTKAELERLATKENGWHVSLFLPTHRAGAEIEQDRIRLKNLLSQAEDELLAAGLRSPEAAQLVAPAQTLLQDSRFWQHMSDGLAVFLSEGLFHRYRLPYDLPPLVVVAEQWHIKPLLPLLSGDGCFYILAISQHQIRLLQGTRHSVDSVDLEGVPKSLPEALRFDDPERQLQFHTATRQPGGKGKRPAAFHGHGVGEGEKAKNDVLRFFHKVDSGLATLLAGERAPMVLAGVDYVLAIYREANQYPNIVDEVIEGNPDQVAAEELHQRAWNILQPLFLQAREEASGRYKALAGSGSEQASSDLQQVVIAAHDGRVDTLFIALREQCWGSFDRQKRAVQTRDEPRAADEDLLDLASVRTLLQGGTIYAVEPQLVPAEGPLAAIFRY